MTTTSATVRPNGELGDPITGHSRTRARVLTVAGAALAATLVHLVALALGADMDVPAFDGQGTQQIAAVGVTLSALAGALIGWGLALAAGRWSARPRATWLLVVGVGLLLSFVPIVAIDATAATRAVLALEHLAVAAVTIPGLARTLHARRVR